jgi:hypothetical protein
MKPQSIIVGLLVAVTAAGCTAPAPEPTAGTTSSADATVGTLDGKLLTVVDLPAGYRSAPLPSLGSDVGTVNGCPALAIKPQSANPPEAHATFTGDKVGSFLTETLRTVTDAEAAKALDELAATPQTCAKFEAQTMGIKVEFSAADADLPSIGDRTVGIRLTASAAGLGTVVDEYLVAIKAGSLLIVVTVVGPGQVDRVTVEAVMRKAWQKASA